MLRETSFQPIEALVHRPSATPHVHIYIVLNTHLDDADNKQDRRKGTWRKKQLILSSSYNTQIFVSIFSMVRGRKSTYLHNI